jgi:hypothetical protein
MAQKVSFTPDAPHIPEDFPHHRYFLHNRDTRVLRFANRHKAQITIDIQDPDTSHASFTFVLSAEACEQLAGALLDAAHDLRTNKASATQVAA